MKMKNSRRMISIIIIVVIVIFILGIIILKNQNTTNDYYENTNQNKQANLTVQNTEIENNNKIIEPEESIDEEITNTISTPTEY